MLNMDVLKIINLGKSYPGVQALKDVNLSFQKGEIHGLIGENGAGKSTLIKILAGVVSSDVGEVYIGGSKAEIKSSKDASRAGLCFIHQELNLVEYFNVMENIFLGHEYPLKCGPFIDWKVLKRKAEEILDKLQVKIPLNIPVSYLSAVEKAMVAIARGFAVSGKIYFMDEPATALTDIEKEKLFTVIKILKNQGKTVVYVSHNLDDVLRITDRITVMRDGTVVECRPTGEMTRNSVITSMIGRNLESAFPNKNATPGQIVFKANSIKNNNIHNVSMEVHAGEILGIGGLVGSGRTELLELVFGITSLKEGQMFLNEEKYLPTSPEAAIERGVVLVPEERRKQGLVLSRSIYENISLMSLNHLATAGFLDHRKLKRKTEEAGRNVRLKTSNYSNHTGTLSGGNQQKVVFAKTVLNPPRLLLLDEPSKGVDVGARFEIYSIIQELAARGTAIIVVSSDFNEILGLADKILFIKEGEPTFIIENSNLDQERYLNYCYGREK